MCSGSAPESSRRRCRSLQPEHELGASSLVDPLGRRAGVELGDQRHEVGVGLAFLDEVLPEPPV